MRVRIVVLLVVALTGFNLLGIPAAASLAPVQDDAGLVATPFQVALRDAIAGRVAAGLPVPEVTYELDSALAGDGSPAARSSGEPVTRGRTVIRYAGPGQAGYQQWPPMVVSNHLPTQADGSSVQEGDYTELYRSRMAELVPGIWDSYEFGQEPRVRVVEETVGRAPGMGIAEPAVPATSAAPGAASDILMGFTYTGPNVYYGLDESAVVLGVTVYHFRAGFGLDWGLGLRLPARVDLTGPSQLIQGSTHQLGSAITPLDWTAGDYANAGVATESGNEFVLRMKFFVGLQGELLGVDLCSACNVDVDVDRSTSFTAPFGTGGDFPIPAAEIPIKKWDLGLFSFDLGLLVRPQIGSTRVTADWLGVAGSDCSGSGRVTYNQPGVSVAVGPVKACNLGPGNEAQVRLGEFRYWFNRFLVELSAQLRFNLFGQGVWNPQYSLAKFDLSGVSAGQWLGRHVQCTWDFSCAPAGPANLVSLKVPVVDLAAPTTTITPAGQVGRGRWFRSPVNVTLSSTDNPIGCGAGVAGTWFSLDQGRWLAYGDPVIISKQGLTTVRYKARDLQGNREHVRYLKLWIDSSKPTISGAPTTPANPAGWYRTAVLVHFAAADAVSGLDRVTPDITLAADGAGQSVKGIALDQAGNRAWARVTGINIDQTGPQLVIKRPQPQAYANTRSLVVRWRAGDSLSGVAEQAGTLDGLALANHGVLDLRLVAAGSHAVAVRASDRAGNQAASEVNFTVTADVAGTSAALARMCELGWIDNAGICASLQAKLAAAAAALDRGNTLSARNLLAGASAQVGAQRGKHISERAADVLLADLLAAMPPQS